MPGPVLRATRAEKTMGKRKEAHWRLCYASREVLPQHRKLGPDDDFWKKVEAQRDELVI